MVAAVAVGAYAQRVPSADVDGSGGVAGASGVEHGLDVDDVLETTEGPLAGRLRSLWPAYLLGTDTLGRSLGVRILTGGGISLGIGIAAAALSVLIGTLYGAIAGYVGGRVDAVMMRIVDILYGLPYILLVVLLAVAADALVERSVVAGVERVSLRREAWLPSRSRRCPRRRMRCA